MAVKIQDLLFILKEDVHIEYFVTNRDGEFVRKYQGSVQALRERRFIVQGASNSYVLYFNISGDPQKGYTVCVGV